MLHPSKYLFFVLICLLFACKTKSQSAIGIVQTAEIDVYGGCNQCKARIEVAAIKVKGVEAAQWDVKEMKLKVVYQTEKCKEVDIHRAMARAGHETSMMKPVKKAFMKLPSCCHYKSETNINQ